MRRWLKLWLLILAASMLAWPWVSAYFQAQESARYIREIYTPVPGRDAYIAMSDDEWGHLFGGHAGLRRLAELSRDSSIIHSAPMKASSIAIYIRSGGYLRDLKSTVALADRSGNWEWSIWARYDYFREWVFTLFA
jgi:hypothetical protein